MLTFLVLLLAAVLALWTGASGALVIWAVLGSVGLMGATTALLQGGLYSLAGLCPPMYVQVHTPASLLPVWIDCSPIVTILEPSKSSMSCVTGNFRGPGSRWGCCECAVFLHHLG